MMMSSKGIVTLSLVLFLVQGMMGLAQEETTPTVATQPDQLALVKLELELPKPAFKGTPKNISSPNLEKTVEGERPPFMVPEGTVNLAEGVEFEASDDEPVIGDVDLINDGDKEAEDGCFVEFGPGVQYVQVDLTKACSINALVVWHYHSQARVYHDMIIRVADDADFTTGVKDIFNNDHDNSAGLGVGKDKEYIETYEGKLIDAKAVQARYLRFYSNGNTSNELNHYTEIEIYGRPVESEK